MNRIFDGYLLVSDMDATLLRDDHTISEENKEAIAYFIENGGRFTVATGRMLDAVRTYLSEVTINMPAVLHNGAKLYDFQNETVLFEKNIEEHRKQAIKAVYEHMPELGLEIYCDEIVYIYKACSETERFLTKSYDVVYTLPQKIWEKPWIKVLLIGDREMLNRYEPIYRSEYDSGNAVRSGERYLDIIANGVSKGRGVKKLAESYRIIQEHVIVVGDNMNDLSMIQFAGTGYCVSNAEPAVKAAADKIAPDNNSSAVAYIIEQLKQEILKK